MTPTKGFPGIRAIPPLVLLTAGQCASAPADHYLDYSLDQLMGLEISSASKRPETIADILASITVITLRSRLNPVTPATGMWSGR